MNLHNPLEPIAVTAKHRWFLDVPATDEEVDLLRKEILNGGALLRIDSKDWKRLWLKLRTEPRFHEQVIINGDVRCSEGVFVGYFSELHATGSIIEIGEGADIASFVAINCADSHKRNLGLMDTIERLPIRIGEHVTIGSHCFIGGGCDIGDYSVLAAGTILGKNVKVPPYSLVSGNPPVIKGGYYHGKT
jgi:acetyltransferase-like isoleucine patch superfamily enzyme